MHNHCNLTNIIPLCIKQRINATNKTKYSIQELSVTYFCSESMVKPNVSIIIPTLNEEEIIGELLEYLSGTFPSAEIIVVDGHSTDRTVEIVSRTVQCISCRRGRGFQMNLGASVARGDIFWFLHADCRPDDASLNAILEFMRDNSAVGGAFRYRFTDQTRLLSVISRFSNFKNRLLGRIYGDMGVFVRRSVFYELGKFSKTMLMEDMEFSKKLNRCGKAAILKPEIITSNRDWVKEGIFGKLIKDSFIKWAHKFGIENKTLYKWYYREAR